MYHQVYNLISVVDITSTNAFILDIKIANVQNQNDLSATTQQYIQ